MKPFRERNPVTIGFVSLAVLGALVLAAFRADQLPLIGGGDTYYANFSEAGGLKPGDEVRVAGVSVGDVEEIELRGDHVRVAFRMDDGIGFGPKSGAEIRVRTILGAMYLSVVPEGTGQMQAGTTIPAKRTVSPYDVIDAFSGLSETTDRIDTQQLAKALDTLSGVADQSPDEFKSAIHGVSALSRKVAARDEQINTLLGNLDKVSGVLADRNDELAKLFRDGQVLFKAVAARRDSIHDLLVATQKLSKELTGLIEDTEGELKPALDNLNAVVQVLRKNQNNLDETLRVSGPFYRVFSNTLGSGPWFDSYIAMPPQLDRNLTKSLSSQLQGVLGGGRQ